MSSIPPVLRAIEVIPATREHYGWILSSFRRKLPWCGYSTSEMARDEADVLRRMLMVGDARAMVATPKGHGDDLLGFVVVSSGAILALYVRQAVRLQGIGTHLISSVTDAVPVPMVYWSPDVEGMAQHGLAVVRDVDTYWKIRAQVRPTRRPERNTWRSE